MDNPSTLTNMIFIVYNADEKRHFHWERKKSRSLLENYFFHIISLWIDLKNTNATNKRTRCLTLTVGDLFFKLENVTCFVKLDLTTMFIK